MVYSQFAQNRLIACVFIKTRLLVFKKETCNRVIHVYMGKKNNPRFSPRSRVHKNNRWRFRNGVVGLLMITCGRTRRQTEPQKAAEENWEGRNAVSLRPPAGSRGSSSSPHAAWRCTGRTHLQCEPVRSNALCRCECPDLTVRTNPGPASVTSWCLVNCVWIHDTIRLGARIGAVPPSDVLRNEKACYSLYYVAALQTTTKK